MTTALIKVHSSKGVVIASPMECVDLEKSIPEDTKPLVINEADAATAPVNEADAATAPVNEDDAATAPVNEDNKEV